MGKPIIWSGTNAKLINSGDFIDKNNLSLTNGDKITVTQASHGFTSSDVGRPLYLSGSTWTLALANASSTAEIAGFIYSVIDSNTLRIATSGQIPTVGANFLEGGGSLTAGTVYFLSATTAGKVTATEPTTVGYVSKPVGVASSTTAFQFFNFRGSIVGSGNARTQISLSNNTTGNVQAVSSYDAGELAGWIYIDATTDYRFYVQAQWAKNGAGTNYNISYQTVGDTPPSGFSLTITSGGTIQYTLPSLAGFVSAVFNYALNAPAVGTNFPLSIDATAIVSGTPTFDTINQRTSTNGVQIQGRTSGSASSTGYLGEVKTLSFSSVSAVTTQWTAQATGISLSAGTYFITGNAVFSSAASSTGASFAVATNANNDTTGFINDVTTVYDPAFGGQWPMNGITVSTSGATLYAKARSYGANRTVQITVYATRVG